MVHWRRRSGLKAVKDRLFTAEHCWLGIWIGAIFLLAMTLTACRGTASPDEIQSPAPGIVGTSTVEDEPTDLPPEPTHTTIADPEPTALSPAYPIEPTQTPTSEVFPTSPPGEPTRLPQPYVIRVLDWDLIEARSPTLCAGCGPGTLEVSAPRGLGIVLLRVYSDGQAAARLTIRTDLAFSEPLTCEVSEDASFCGAIFGQVVNGQVTIISEADGGTDNEILYYLTFQRWADYLP